MFAASAPWEDIEADGLIDVGVASLVKVNPSGAFSNAGHPRQVGDTLGDDAENSDHLGTTSPSSTSLQTARRRIRHFSW